jgi:hypothetical protein
MAPEVDEGLVDVARERAQQTRGRGRRRPRCPEMGEQLRLARAEALPQLADRGARRRDGRARAAGRVR